MADRFLVLVNQHGHELPHFYEVVADTAGDARLLAYWADDQLDGGLQEALADDSSRTRAAAWCYATAIGQTDRYHPIKRLWLTNQPRFEQPKEERR